MGLDWWNYYTSLRGRANKSNIFVQLQNIHLNLVQGGKLKSTSLYFEVGTTVVGTMSCISESGEGWEEWDLMWLMLSQGWGKLKGRQSCLLKAVDLCSGLLARLAEMTVISWITQSQTSIFEKDKLGHRTITCLYSSWQSAPNLEVGLTFPWFYRALIGKY